MKEDMQSIINGLSTSSMFSIRTVESHGLLYTHSRDNNSAAIIAVRYAINNDLSVNDNT